MRLKLLHVNKRAPALYVLTRGGSVGSTHCLTTLTGCQLGVWWHVAGAYTHYKYSGKHRLKLAPGGAAIAEIGSRKRFDQDTISTKYRILGDLSTYKLNEMISGIAPRDWPYRGRRWDLAVTNNRFILALSFSLTSLAVLQLFNCQWRNLDKYGDSIPGATRNQERTNKNYNNYTVHHPARVAVVNLAKMAETIAPLRHVFSVFMC